MINILMTLIWIISIFLNLGCRSDGFRFYIVGQNVEDGDTLQLVQGSAPDDIKVTTVRFEDGSDQATLTVDEPFVVTDKMVVFDGIKVETSKGKWNCVEGDTQEIYYEEGNELPFIKYNFTCSLAEH